MALLLENGSGRIVQQDGSAILLQSESAPSAATMTAAVVEAGDTPAGTASVQARATMTGAITEDADTPNGSATQNPAGIVLSAAITELPDTPAGDASLTGFVMSGAVFELSDLAAGTGAILFPVLMSAAIVEDRDSAQGVVVSSGDGKLFFPNRPVRAEAPAELAAPKRDSAPIRRLPDPPETYDPVWQAEFHQQLIAHLDSLVSSQSANHGVPVRSPSGKVFHLSVDDDGKVTSTHLKG